ncbi:MAG: hypothetical protein H6827_10125 [Planctomycetes bacterium]|nr:hypothetical protein [Planctomycetota bacterium]
MTPRLPQDDPSEVGKARPRVRQVPRPTSPESPLSIPLPKPLSFDLLRFGQWKTCEECLKNLSLLALWKQYAFDTDCVWFSLSLLGVFLHGVLLLSFLWLMILILSDEDIFQWL